MARYKLVELAQQRNTDIPTLIVDEINRANGNISKAAKELGVVHSVLYHHMEANNIKMCGPRYAVQPPEECAS